MAAHHVPHVLGGIQTHVKEDGELDGIGAAVIVRLQLRGVRRQGQRIALTHILQGLHAVRHAGGPLELEFPLPVHGDGAVQAEVLLPQPADLNVDTAVVFIAGLLPQLPGALAVPQIQVFPVIGGEGEIAACKGIVALLGKLLLGMDPVAPFNRTDRGGGRRIAKLIVIQGKGIGLHGGRSRLRVHGKAAGGLHIGLDRKGRSRGGKGDGLLLLGQVGPCSRN